MFLVSQPKIKNLIPWTKLPEKYRQKKLTDWSRVNQGGKESDSFLEGPVFDKQGNLFVTDIPNGRIFRVTPTGDWDLVTQWDGEPNGMKFMSESEILIADYMNGLLVLDTKSGQIKPFLSRKNTESFKGVNDLTYDSKGNLYFTDQGQTGLHDPTGRVFRLNASGKLDLLISNIPSPNGITLSKDEKFLFVAATRGNCIWRMPLMQDGSISKAGQFFTSYGPSGPDGLAINEEGHLLIANPGLAYIWILNHLAEPIEILRGVSGTSLTNLAFGGSLRKTIYCTDSTNGEILKAELDVKGATIYNGQGAHLL
jgi:gluconolactonase